MEIVKLEVAAIVQTVSDAEVVQLQQLDDVQLALVGGGTGDVHWG